MRAHRRLSISSLDAHFRRCAALAAAGAGSGIAAPKMADAAIVWSGIVNLNIPSTTAGVYLNIVTGVSNADPALVPGWDVNPWSSSALNMFSQAGGGHVGPVSGGTTYFNLMSGSPVGPASSFGGAGTQTIDPGTPLNFNSDSNLIGFRFANEANGNQIHYGWMRIALSGAAQAQPRSIVEYSYENTAGAALVAGIFPEPSALGLLALGAVTVIRRRR